MQQLRTDEKIAAAIMDPQTLRALILAMRQSERDLLCSEIGLEAKASPDHLTNAIEALIRDEIGGNNATTSALALSVWAAKHLGASAPLTTLEAADTEIRERTPSNSAIDEALAASLANDKQARLLKIAIQFAHLRHKKTARIGWWSPLLNLLIGHPEMPVPASVAESEAPNETKETPSQAGAATASEDMIWQTLKGAGTRLPLSVWEERLSEAQKALGRFNIIVAGRTGVGKTTLIGAIFGEEIGNTLMGRPRTRGRIWYPLEPSEADVLRLCDTEGMEMERYEETLGGLRREVESRNASNDPFDHIHVAWLCIDEPSLTVQPGEEALVELLAQEGIPVIIVLTKAGMAPRFQEKVTELLPKATNVVRVRATPIEIEGQSFPAMGLNALMQATEAAIPNAVEAAWQVASRNLQANLKRAEQIVRQAAATAGAAGATPIPLADAAGVFGVQVGMIIAVSLNMGIKLQRSDLRAMAVTLLGALGLTAGGRFIAGQVVKLIPGLGTIAGSAITGTTAAALTYGLGRAYVEYLRSFFEKNHRMPNPDELVSGFRRYWQQWKNKYDSPGDSANS